jgi:transcription initiation factor TFIIIB Brf1 subunit/transcription initiation factor TFIIB
MNQTRLACPECEKHIRSSHLEQNRYVCKNCNIVLEEEDVVELRWDYKTGRYVRVQGKY